MTFRLFFLVTFACLTPLAKGGVVINEIHHDPNVKTELAEFIELHNTGTEPVDLSGWEIGDAVVFTFPDGCQCRIYIEVPAPLLGEANARDTLNISRQT